MQNHSTSIEDVKQEDISLNCLTKEKFVWVGDNLGSGNKVIINAKSDSGEFSLNLEEALRTIDQFVEYGRNRILSALSFHFDLEAV